MTLNIDYLIKKNYFLYHKLQLVFYVIFIGIR